MIVIIVELLSLVYADDILTCITVIIIIVIIMIIILVYIHI